MEKFAIGLTVGGLVGALLVANNYKMRALVKKGQQEVQDKLDELLDKKLHEGDAVEDAEQSLKKREKKTTE